MTGAVPRPMCLSSTTRQAGPPAALDRPSALKEAASRVIFRVAGRDQFLQPGDRPGASISAVRTLPPARRNFSASANPSRVAPD